MESNSEMQLVLFSDLLFYFSQVLGEVNIGFPTHFRHLSTRIRKFSIQFCQENLSVFKSRVQYGHIVIHIRQMFYNDTLFSGALLSGFALGLL